MGIVMKPIEMIALFDINGKSRPIRFRFQNDDGEMQVMKDFHVICSNTNRVVGNIMSKFECEAYADNGIKRFELLFEKDTSKWSMKYQV